MTPEELCKVLNGKRVGHKFIAHCPAHEDNKSSLCIDKGDSQPIIVHCQAGCNFIQIISALKNIHGISFNGNGDKTARRIVDFYEYKNATGEVLYQKLRYEPKDFRVRRADWQASGKWSIEDVERVPYRLPEVLQAAKDNKIIFIVEGEKDADNLFRLGLVATTSGFGASKDNAKPKWPDSYSEFLKGAKGIIVLPDNDDSGKAHANAAAKSLAKIDIPVKIVYLPDLQNKQDISDFIAKFDTPRSAVEKLGELCNQAPWYPASGDKDSRVDVIADEEIFIHNWPELPSEALYGLAGRIVQASVEKSEADPAAVLAAFLTRVAAIFGRQTWIDIGEEVHHARLFCMVVGKSSLARKGTSLAPIKRICDDAESRLSIDRLRVTSGLSSGEGLIGAIRDPREKRGDEAADAGIVDKRLLLIESEFARVLQVMRRQGNTLTGNLRDVWDHGNISSLTKRDPIEANNGHINLLGHITRDELLKLLDQVEFSNGVINRFLWFCARRSKSLAFPEKMSDQVVNSLASDLYQSIMFAHRKRVANVDKEAAFYYKELYDRITSEEVGGRIGDIIARGPAQIQRLALIYSLLDCSDMVRLPHFKAANAVWEYSLASAKWIFMPPSESVTSGNSKLHSKILAALSDEDKTQTELLHVCKNIAKKQQLAQALDDLQAIRRVVKKKGQSTGGRIPEVWSLVR